MNEFERELLSKLIQYTNMQDVDLGAVSAESTLYGKDSTFGLDSIDAIEIEVMIKKEYGIDVHPSERSEATFGTVGSLALFIEANRDRNL
jgi:acyl carrier protein